MIFDYDSVNETAVEFGLTPDEVERALSVAAIYKRHHQHYKELRKQERNALARRLELEAEKRAEPQRCFCLEDGFVVVRRVEDDIIRYETMPCNDYFGRWTGKNYDDPVYRCSRCGKEWRVQIGIA